MARLANERDKFLATVVGIVSIPLGTPLISSETLTFQSTTSDVASSTTSVSSSREFSTFLLRRVHFLLPSIMVDRTVRGEVGGMWFGFGMGV